MSPLAAALHALVSRRIKARLGVIEVYQYLYNPALISLERVLALGGFAPEDKYLLTQLVILPTPQLDQIIKNDLQLYLQGYGLSPADHAYYQTTLRNTAKALISPPA